ncbi:MAG: SGNH/GDSL hydrolase family protein [Candidatus Obscuribacterales bacterium]
MKIKIFNKRFDILPGLAFNYFLYSFIGILAVCFFIDAFVLTYLEDKGKICSYSWRQENNRLLSQIKKRNWADANNPVWRSEGFQVEEKCPKSKRILVMGDSFVWGSGYANMNTIWWRQLQRELQRRGYNDVEVIAAGMSGASTKMELEWAKKLVPIYKPDAVIWGYVTNDPDEGSDKAGFGIVKTIVLPGDDIPERPKSIFSDLFPNLSDELFNGLRKGTLTFRLSGEKYGFDFANWELKLLEGKNWQEYKGTVSELGRYLNSLEVPSFVVTLPCCVYATEKPLPGKTLIDKIRNYYEARYNKVAALFKQNQIEWHDALDAFCSTAKSDPRFYSPDPPLWLGINPANGHPGPMGTYVHAVEAANILESKYPQVLGKKTMPVETATVRRVNDWTPALIHLRQDANHIYFEYPENDEEMLTMPLRKPFVSLNFETPVNVKSISLNGKCLKSAQIYYSAEDPDKHYDDGELTDLGQKKGNFEVWTVPPTPRSTHVNTLRISAQFSGPDHGLLLDVLSDK